LFPPNAVRAREDYIRSVADETIDSFIESGQCDLLSQYCAPVPAIVVLDWLGLPTKDWKVWSDALLNQFANPGQTRPDVTALDTAAIIAALHERRENPREDVLMPSPI
jgi:cytochrome P450